MTASEAAVAAALVADHLRARPAERRGLFLRNVLAHAAAGLALIEGDEAASAVVYRIADAVAARGGSADRKNAQG